jgi:hypothetical protein
MSLQMAIEVAATEGSVVAPERPQVLELADGTRLVSEGEARPAVLSGDRDHAFTFADVQREGAEPFAGYVRLS